MGIQRHTNGHICVRVYAHTLDICACTPTCMLTCAHIHAVTCIGACVNAPVCYMYMHACVCATIYTYMDVCKVHMLCMHTDIDTKMSIDSIDLISVATHQVSAAFRSLVASNSQDRME